MISKEVFGLLKEFLENGEKVLEVGCGTGKLSAVLLYQGIVKSIDAINDEDWSTKPKWKFQDCNKRDNLHFENKKFSEVTEKYDRIFFINSFQFLFDDNAGNLDADRVEQVEEKLHDILLPGEKAFIYITSFAWFKQNDKPMVAEKVLFSTDVLEHFTKFDLDWYFTSEDDMVIGLTKRV